jgi:hypothetical protein
MKRWFYDYNILILLSISKLIKMNQHFSNYSLKRNFFFISIVFNRKGQQKKLLLQKNWVHILLISFFQLCYWSLFFCKTILVTNLYSWNCPTFITSWLKWPTVADSSQIYSLECEIHYLVFKLDIDIECLILECNPQKSHIKNI